jgi:hypothetical protein
MNNFTYKAVRDATKISEYVLGREGSLYKNNLVRSVVVMPARCKPLRSFEGRCGCCIGMEAWLCYAISHSRQEWPDTTPGKYITTKQNNLGDKCVPPRGTFRVLKRERLLWLWSWTHNSKGITLVIKICNINVGQRNTYIISFQMSREKWKTIDVTRQVS